MDSTPNDNVQEALKGIDVEAGGTMKSQAAEENDVPKRKRNGGGAGGPKTRKKTSEVWKHFECYIDEEDNVQRSKCIHCGAKYCYTSQNGTTAMRFHLDKCLELPANRKDVQFVQTQLAFGNRQVDEVTGKGKAILVAWKFDQQLARKALCYMVIVDELPFRVVEGKGFIYLMSVCCPSFVIPSRSTVTRDVFELYMEEKCRLKSFIKNCRGRVCLTTDTWTSKQKESYMCLTAHFIDLDWKLHKCILNFCPIASHKGSDIGEYIYKCLLDWGITGVFTLTVDNASSNDTVVGYLKKKFQNLHKCILGGKYVHMRCMAHILNLIAQDGLKTACKSVQSVRLAVKYVKMSPTRLKLFKDLAEMDGEYKKHICLDVATRWNSTYLMLSTAIEYQSVFDAFIVKHPEIKVALIVDDGPGVPTTNDWENVKRLCDYLDCFYNVTVQVSGSKYVTSSEFVSHLAEIDGLVKLLIVDEDKNTSKMRNIMHEKYKKYWGDVQKMNKIAYMCSVIDPRRKLAYLSFMLQNVYEKEIAQILVNDTRHAMVDMFDDYRRLYEGDGTVTSSISPLDKQHDTQGSITSRNRGKIKFRLEEQYARLSASSSDEISTELEKYFAEEVVPMKKPGFDLLDWWKNNKSRYPILSEMARDLLAVPVSTVASESAFSTGGRVLDTFRSSLTPRIVQALICAQDWMRAAGSPLHIKEDVIELHKVEEELEASKKDCIFFDNI